jgi:hypothetical protein
MNFYNYVSKYGRIISSYNNKFTLLDSSGHGSRRYRKFIPSLIGAVKHKVQVKCMINDVEHQKWIYPAFLAHRFVADMFLIKPEGCDVVHHINNNGLDNRINNLAWVTQSDNISHAVGVKCRSINTKTGKQRDFLSLSSCAKTHQIYSETEWKFKPRQLVAHFVKTYLGTGLTVDWAGQAYKFEKITALVI